MFRRVGKAIRELWAAVVVCLAVVSNIQGMFDDTWLSTAMNWLSLLVVMWLVFFAIGISRGEPNP